jgi:hypothetical protein
VPPNLIYLTGATIKQVAAAMQVPQRTKQLQQVCGPKFSGRSRNPADRRAPVNLLLTNAA